MIKLTEGRNALYLAVSHIRMIRSIARGGSFVWIGGGDNDYRAVDESPDEIIALMKAAS
jgi:hypothetical protein